MAKTSQRVHRAALAAGTVAVIGLITACGSSDGTTSAPQKLPGTTPAGTGSTAGSASAAPPSALPSDSVTVSQGVRTSPASAAGSRCHTSELRASVGRNNPGAGQENFPVVLTNASSRTCTVRGYPGAAFLDASGRQLGPDPKRSAGTPGTVTLAPGHSAWAGLTFSNPEVSGARAATPAALLVTPPDERDPLKVTWKGGPIPVGGNASSVFLTVFSSGTGA